MNMKEQIADHLSLFSSKRSHLREVSLAYSENSDN